MLLGAVRAACVPENMHGPPKPTNFFWAAKGGALNARNWTIGEEFLHTKVPTFIDSNDETEKQWPCSSEISEFAFVYLKLAPMRKPE